MPKRTFFICLIIALAFLHLQNVQAQETNSIFYSTESGSSGRDIYRMDASGANYMKLTKRIGNGHYPHNIHPKLSPDGTKLVFQSDPDGHDRYTIWTMNTDGSNLTKITEKEGMFPNWHPDGSKIIFSGRRNGIWEILLVPVKGGQEVNLSKNHQQRTRPSWGATCSFHPSGNHFVYSYIREKVLYKFDIKTNTTVKITSNGNYTHPAYSSDGVLAVNRKINQTYDLVIIQNKIETVLSENVISYSAPAWCSSNKAILFTGSVKGNKEIFRVDLKSGEETQLTKFDPSVSCLRADSKRCWQQ